MLENLELFGNSLGVGTYPDGEGKSFLQNIFDVIHPIGETYIQYPAQKTPQEIYNKKDGDRIIIDSVWEEQLQYNSAFFRSEHPNTYAYKAAGEEQYYDIDNNNNLTPIKVTGNNDIAVAGSPTSGQQKIVDGKTYQAYAITGINTSSNPYIIETNGLSKQEQSIQSHKHSNTVSVTTQPTFKTEDTNKTFTYWSRPLYDQPADGAPTGIDGVTPVRGSGDSRTLEGNGSVKGSYRYTPNLSHGHTVTRTTNVAISITNVNEGSTETKPINYTIRIWKRIL